ncbi:MAG: metallo-mystery pair system four-Cys motif protein [Glaciecola sp.]|nr:metallo-mystery pair system four-Cys motif protein [Glaciecola sp.]
MIIKRAIYALIIVFCMGCSEQEIPATTLNFFPVFGTQNIDCDKAVDIKGDVWFFSQLQFFVSNVELQNKQGQWHKSTLTITPEQTEQIALLGSTCQKSEPENWQLKFDEFIELADYQAIRFSLGVPFEQNHLNPLTQPSPLNVSSMFWVWQTGHKFARIEMKSESDDWLFHLGSTGCRSASVMRAPNNTCLYPNLFTMEVALGSSNKIVFDLEILLEKLDLSMEASCQSEQDNKVCQKLFSYLNQESEQVVFRAVSND